MGRLFLHDHHQPGADGKAGQGPSSRAGQAGVRQGVRQVTAFSQRQVTALSQNLFVYDLISFSKSVISKAIRFTKNMVNFLGLRASLIPTASGAPSWKSIDR